jgi:hypothetical protein
MWWCWDGVWVVPSSTGEVDGASERGCSGFRKHRAVAEGPIAKQDSLQPRARVVSEAKARFDFADLTSVLSEVVVGVGEAS